MKTTVVAVFAALAALTGICPGIHAIAADPAQPLDASQAPAPLSMEKAKAEVETKYNHAHPEVREYVLWTAQSFGRSALWLNEDAFAAMTDSWREERILYLKKLLEDSEYGRHLCNGLAEASALKDARLVPGLLKVAGYHRDDVDYDCRPKWMAVAALARQESDSAMPLLVSLVDHGNQNTRNWARAALARKTGQDFGQDKLAWANWWRSQGHDAIQPEFLKSWKPAATATTTKPEPGSSR